MTTAAPLPGDDNNKPEDNTPDTFMPQWGTKLPAGYLPSTYVMNMVLTFGQQYRILLIDAGVPSGIAELEMFKIINNTFNTLYLYDHYSNPF